MLRFFPYILKTLWRHRARTILTMSGVATALFIFCFVGAIHEGMHDLRRRQEAKHALVAFQANKFCPATSHLPQDYERTIRSIAGVREVVPIQVFTNNCRASLDVVVFYGIPADMLQQAREFQLMAGSWRDFEQQQDGAMMGAAVARRRQVNVGDRFSIGEVTVAVVGIYRSDDPAEENYIYTHLDFLQRRKGSNRVGTVTQFEVLLEAGAAPITICQQIDATFRSAAVPTQTRPKGVFQAKSLGDLTQLIGLSYYLGLACVGLVLVLVTTTTLMSVQDRVQEHAILQTIGFSGLRVFVLVLAESVLLAIFGGAAGVAASMSVLRFSGLAVGAEGVMMAFQPSLSLMLNGLAISAVSGIIAGTAPAWQAARTDIVPALRRG